jgi:hypothetical protein
MFVALKTNVHVSICSRLLRRNVGFRRLVMHLLSFQRLLVSLIASQSALCANAPSVQVCNGTVIGTKDVRNNVEKFLGIPYAQPPIGDLRLRQARPLNTTFRNLDASKSGPACYGRGNPNPSEDCLSINIWRPAGLKGDQSLPVMVWFYGGALQSGYNVSPESLRRNVQPEFALLAEPCESKADPLLDGTNMVRIAAEVDKRIIVVTPVGSTAKAAYRPNADCGSELAFGCLGVPERQANGESRPAQHWHVGPATRAPVDPREHRCIRRRSKERLVR